MRLIDADEMIKNLKAMKTMYDAIELDGMIKGLEESKTVDAEPVLHGRWIYHNVIPATCSVCGFSCGMYDDDSSDRYCSHCGAKMDGGETHADD